jgi:GR25 family glycosyltransferase involved in LPS biosynthesis
MKCIYINLERATARRAQLEANWAEYGGSDWQLERFPAVDARYIEENGIPGNLRPGEKACFFSHSAVIEMNRGATAPLFIMEDDMALGKSSAATIDNFLGVCDNHDWDIAFTDVCVPLPQTMLDLVKLRHELSETGEVRLLDLKDIIFAGSTAYLVNHRSLDKISGLLAAHESLDVPYDLALRQLIHHRKLKGLVFFPFATSLGDESDVSQIQQDGLTDLVWNAFRKLMWIDRDLAQVWPAVEKINTQVCDDESRLLGVVLGGMLTKSFVLK